MGLTYVSVTVHGRKASKDIKMLVDTGSTYIVLNPEVICELGLIETPFSVELTLANKRRIKAKLYLAEVEIRGRRGPAFIAELDVPTPVLGVYALETLGFKVNPRTGELEESSLSELDDVEIAILFGSTAKFIRWIKAYSSKAAKY